MSTERGNLLLRTGRHDLAEQEYRQALLTDPRDALAHAMLGLCLVHRKEFKQATAEAQEAIHIRPDWDFGYHTLGVVLLERNRLKEALRATNEALRLDPWDPDHHGLLASILLEQRKWPDALAAADKGLQVQPDHASCINARGSALTMMGRRDAAASTIDGALAKDPENALTHANRGWALLHAGDAKQAQIHFREALRLKPEMAWAKSGMVESLKARNPIYRLMLRYFLFMSKLNRRAQWMVLIVGYAGYQTLKQYSSVHPESNAWVHPVMYTYIAFAVLTWLSAPLFNLMLRLDRFGKYALSSDQILAANCVGSSLALVLALGTWSFVGGSISFFMMTLVLGILTMPLAGLFNCPVGWPRWTMFGFVAALYVVAGFLALALFLPEPFAFEALASRDSVTHGLFTTIIFGVFISSWIANALMMAKVRR